MTSSRCLRWRLSAIVCLVFLTAACGPWPSATEGIVLPTAVSPDSGPSSPVRAPATPTPFASPPASPKPIPMDTDEPDAAGGEPRLTPIQPVFPEPVPTGAKGLGTGEVPEELLDAILADAAARFGVEPGAFTVVQAEVVTWSDGSLGCPRPGMLYTQALVNGYRVVLTCGDQTFDYRADDDGYFFHCRDLAPW